MNDLLKRRWALVTGSSRGIGRQIALGLAQCGCNIVLHGRKKENADMTLDILKDYKIETGVVEGELSDQYAVTALCKEALRISGNIDILYNNAAVMSKMDKIWDIPLKEWKRVFEINLFALITISNFFIPKMAEKGFGRIVNITSGIKDQPGLAPYSAVKAAVDKYTLDTAAELKGTNVLISNLDPGWLRTDLGSQNAPYAVETVVPGAIAPALLEDFGPNGSLFHAQDFKMLKL